MDTELTLTFKDFTQVKRFTEIANMFNSDIDIIRGRYVLDAKSTLSIYTIDLSKPLTIRIISDDKAEICRFNEKMKEFLPEY